MPDKISAIPFTSVALEMVEANMGVTCLPEWVLNPFKPSEQFMMKKIGKHGLKRTIFLVHRKTDSDKQFVQDFVQNMDEEFRN